MKIKNYLLRLFFILLCLNVAAQDDTTLLFSIPLGDFPYESASVNIYGEKALLSPSMYQSLEFTSSLYNFGYWLTDRINYDRLSDKTWKKLLAQLAVTYAREIALTYLPGGDAWLHEEYHRSILTAHGISSHDQVYDLPIFAQVISVNNVSDQDLANFKRYYPSDFVRLSEAGIEGEYLLISNLQKRSFFNNQPYPYWLSELSITINSVYYVFFCHTSEANRETDEFNAKENNIADRDFVGFDFTAWTYDLFRPDEPYYERGLHPSGIGIDRYIKPDDLNADEYRYLKKQGTLAFINFLSPFLVGKNEFDINGVKYNFGFRHMLTSFGYDIVFQNFIKTNSNFLINFHTFFSKNLTLPAIEFELYREPAGNNTHISFHSFLGLQPQNLSFYDTLPSPVAYTALRIDHSLRTGGIFLELSAKSQGWIPGETYQTPSFNFRFGITFNK